MTAIKTADDAANAEFDRYLHSTRSTATFSVPPCVTDAAMKAYELAGGRGKIEVVGHGNRTHPVCSVEVRRAK